MNTHHRRALYLYVAVIGLNFAFGALFGWLNHCGVGNGIYFAVVTVTTVGYGDITPHGWAAHLVALGIMLLIIPLWTGAFSLVTTGLTANHIDKRHDDMKNFVVDATSTSS